MKFLIIRTDRIGDVMLSLPVAQTIREQVPDAEIHMMTREPIAELISDQPFIDEVIPYKSNGIPNAIRKLRMQQYDTAFLLYPTFPLSLELFLARIRRRVGTGYRWYSFLLNSRIYEHRQTSERHEVEYNLNLLKAIGIDETARKPQLFISEQGRNHAKTKIREYGIDWRNFIVVHPGSGGSTLSLPEQSFRQLVSLLADRTSYMIALSGNNQERAMTDRIHKGTRGKIVNIAGKTTLKELAGIISMAKLFIGNSTGPMQIASAIQTPVVAFFPPSRANRKTRWAPLTSSLIFEPPVPHCPRCIRERCEYYNCMTLINPEEVFEKMLEWLDNEIKK